MSKTVYVGCCVLCHVLPNLTSYVVLNMDWLHTINPLLECNTYSLSLEFVDEIVYILGTKCSFCHAFVKVCTLKSVLKTMCGDKVPSWFGVL